VNVIIFGAPGAGKGTQAESISKKFNLFQFSTGDLLRKEIKNKTDIGKEIQNILSQGNFATDDIVNELLEKIVTNPKNKNRIIFDGYPRNINQAKNLEIILKTNNQYIDFILYLKVSREVIEERILERITCEKCNKTFNKIIHKLEIENHSCGTEYIKTRNDDNKNSIIKRHDEFMTQTKPVLDFYSSRTNFHEIDGSLKIQEIKGKIEQILTV